MALSQSARSELLDAIRAGGSVDVMREAMTLVLQELIEAEPVRGMECGGGACAGETPSGPSAQRGLPASRRHAGARLAGRPPGLAMGTPE